MSKCQKLKCDILSNFQTIQIGILGVFRTHNGRFSSSILQEIEADYRTRPKATSTAQVAFTLWQYKGDFSLVRIQWVAHGFSPF